MDKEKVQKIDEKINQLKAQKQALLAREKEKERKARTRKLIQAGAILEKYSQKESLEDMVAWLDERL
jgi:phage shock protein A